MASETDIIKEKLNIADFLKDYIDLKPAGKNLKALCPFHGEKTPSFIVSPERRSWRCFGACGEGGDIFSFLMKRENIEFHEALKILAERAGVPLAQFSPREQKEFGVLYDINEEAKNFYKNALKKNSEVLTYLKDRGLKDETIEEFELGFSPGGEVLFLHLLEKGNDIGDIVRAGLARKNIRGLYRDNFFRRIIFPIWSNVGKVVAFTGRSLPWDETAKEMPKYLNSSETAIFNKSKTLYGLDRSKNEIARERTVFFVEGQMDFLMSWQSGIRYAVAVSGTGLTQDHLLKLRRLADTAILSFDNDEAGMRALERSLDVFSGFDFYVKVITLGEHKDPADAVNADPEFLKKAVAEAKPALGFLFRTGFDSIDTSDLAAKKRLIRRLLEKIKKIKSASEQAVWLKDLARVSGVPETALSSDLQELRETTPYPSSGVEEEKRNGKDKPGEVDGRRGLIARRLLSIAFLKDDFFEELKKHWEYLPASYLEKIENPGSEAMLELQMEASCTFQDIDAEKLEKEFQELLRELQLEFLSEEQAKAKEKIRKGMMIGEENQDILNELYDISKKIDRLKNASA